MYKKWNNFSLISLSPNFPDSQWMNGWNFLHRISSRAETSWILSFPIFPSHFSNNHTHENVNMFDEYTIQWKSIPSYFRLYAKYEIDQFMRETTTKTSKIEENPADFRFVIEQGGKSSESEKLLNHDQHWYITSMMKHVLSQIRARTTEHCEAFSSLLSLPNSFMDLQFSHALADNRNKVY